MLLFGTRSWTRDGYGDRPSLKKRGAKQNNKANEQVREQTVSHLVHFVRGLVCDEELDDLEVPVGAGLVQRGRL